MHLSLKSPAVATLLTLAAILSACSGDSGGTLTSALKGGGSTQGVTGFKAVSPPDAPPGITNDNPMARPASVAWTSARAKRCGFFFDPDKLRTTFLASEARQPGVDQAKVQSTYDNTYKLIFATTSADQDYCTDKRSADIKAELARHLAGDFTPNLPKPIMVANCGMFGCGKEQQEFEAKKFFKEQDKKTGF
ncbi:MAG: hypothetical protein NW223_14860 [Hyphomicrobiaceae bacterium]|nr:hypothetical protein [Hyphomicrobiaceae bacterium]